MEILRSKELSILKTRLRDFKVAAILGPRQCGKTTLARQFARSQPAGKVTVFDLENPADLAKSAHDGPGGKKRGQAFYLVIAKIASGSYLVSHAKRTPH